MIEFNAFSFLLMSDGTSSARWNDLMMIMVLCTLNVFSIEFKLSLATLCSIFGWDISQKFLTFLLCTLHRAFYICLYKYINIKCDVWFVNPEGVISSRCFFLHFLYLMTMFLKTCISFLIWNFYIKKKTVKPQLGLKRFKASVSSLKLLFEYFWKDWQFSLKLWEVYISC